MSEVMIEDRVEETVEVVEAPAMTVLDRLHRLEKLVLGHGAQIEMLEEVVGI